MPVPGDDDLAGIIPVELDEFFREGEKMITKVNISEKLNLIRGYYKPKVVGQVNETYVKLVRFKGEFIWHKHDLEDELFLVVKGRLTIRLRDRTIELHENEFVVIPRGVEHLPVAEDEVSVMLIEPKTTVNTGNVHDERTLTDLDWI